MTDDRPPGPSKAVPLPKTGEIERLGPDGRDVMILGLEAPGFEELLTDSKIFSYYLYRAAIAGDAIMYMQNHRHAFEIKQMLEAIFTCPAEMPEDVRDSVHDYVKYFWIHHGNYHHGTHTKFLPNTMTRESLRRAAEIALASGADLEIGSETLDEKLSRLDRTIFEIDYETLQSNQAKGADIVATSAVNFYDPGLTHDDINALGSEWTNKINVRFKNGNGKAVPESFMIGGAYSGELETICHFLRLAIPHAESDDQRNALELLVEFYETGDENIFRRHSIHWLKSDTTIDFLNGFIEQYIDPRGVIANFEGNVSFASDATLPDRLANNALYFEKKMPWPDKYQRKKIKRPVAKVVNVIVETGDAGPVSPAAYNLPNYNDIRRDHGSKNVMFLNVENSRSMKLFKTMVNEFYLPEYRENQLKYRIDVLRPLEVYLHEIIGHGSGQPDHSLKVDPRTAIGRAYSPLEECRADLVALYHMSDPKLVEIGAFETYEQQTVVEAAYISYTQGWMTMYDRIDGYQVREAHNQGHQLILMYLVENGGDPNNDFGVRVIEQGGHFFVKIDDPEKMRVGIGQLLGKLQVMKSTGDAAGAAELFDRFASHVKPEWKDDMIERLGRLNVPRLKAFVFPRLTPVMKNGKITDVQISNDEDLTAQHLRISRLRHSTDIGED